MAVYTSYPRVLPCVKPTMDISFGYKSSEEGLSLLELVAVMGIATLVGASIIPRLLGSRVAVNEMSTILNINSITAAQHSYNAAYPQIGYADRLEKLARRRNRPCRPTPELACLIDPRVAVGNLVPWDGYYVSLGSRQSPSSPRKTYVIAAVPSVAHEDGDHDFCATEDGVIRCQPASPGETPDSITWSSCRALPSCFY